MNNYYITSHYINNYYITLIIITLHYITLIIITLHYITLLIITLHYITLHNISKESARVAQQQSLKRTVRPATLAATARTKATDGVQQPEAVPAAKCALPDLHGGTSRMLPSNGASMDGLFTNRTIASGSVIGIYTGRLHQVR